MEHRSTSGDGESRPSDRAGMQATSAAEQVGSKATGAAEQIKQTAQSAAKQQQERGADKMAGIAEAVHGAAQELEAQLPSAAGYVHDAADGLQRMSSSLRESSLNDLIGGVGKFAREQPAAFFGGAVLAGFALSRFLKSSGERNH